MELISSVWRPPPDLSHTPSLNAAFLPIKQMSFEVPERVVLGQEIAKADEGWEG